MNAMAAPGGILLCLLLAIPAGCRPDASIPAARPVAWVAGDTLDSEQLGRLLVLAQPFPLEAGAVVDLVRHWQLTVALARFPGRRAQAVAAAAGVAAGDAAIAAYRTAQLGDAALAAAGQTPAAWARGELRLVGHILRRADREARIEERTVQRRAAESIRRDLLAGTEWREANRRNEDDAARAAGGMIGLVTRGELPPALDSVAFALAPGAISDVIETDAGFHVVHRPALADARAEFTRRLADRIAQDQERGLGAAVAERRNAMLAPIAAVRLRELALDPWASLAANDPVGSFEGGGITGGTLAALLAELAWDARRLVAAAPADAREAFAGRALVRATLRAEAAAAGMAADTAVLRARIAASIDSIVRHVPHTADEPRLGVDRYLGSLMARHITMVMPPAALWQASLGSLDTGFRADVIAHAIDRARVLLTAGGYTDGAQ